MPKIGQKLDALGGDCAEAASAEEAEVAAKSVPRAGLFGAFSSLPLETP